VIAGWNAVQKLKKESWLGVDRSPAAAFRRSIVIVEHTTRRISTT
jgi:hypothetical protein